MPTSLGIELSLQQEQNLRGLLLRLYVFGQLLQLVQIRPGVYIPDLVTPGVLEVRVDPEIPPMAPHVKTTMVKKSIKAMAAGDPEAMGVMEKSIREKLVEFKESIPGLKRSGEDEEPAPA